MAEDSKSVKHMDDAVHALEPGYHVATGRPCLVSRELVEASGGEYELGDAPAPAPDGGGDGGGGGN
jgi:hypothetical protein